MLAAYCGKVWIMNLNKMVRLITKIENLAFFITGLILFHNFSNNWILFLLLILLPDISLVGYLQNKRVGALIYNSIHNYILPLLLLAMGSILIQTPLLIASSILIAHVGVDRFLGYGLKYKEDFKSTHIQKL